MITDSNILEKQIQWLRLLTTVSRDEIKLMPKYQTPWVGFHTILDNLPDKPIHSRQILRNEIVLEIDSSSWEEVRDGTRRITMLLDEWGAPGSYYLSFSGNRSIHVHLFINISSVLVHAEVIPLLEGHDDVIPSVKSYLTLQISRAARSEVDMQLTGKHLIRMEGGFNEKSRKYCTLIDKVPDDKPVFYDVAVPSALPPSVWDLSKWENEINAFLMIRYAESMKPVYHYANRPFDPEPLKEILRPVFIPGYRHWVVISLAGWLRRHAIPETRALEIIRALNINDRTPAKTASTIREVYRAQQSDRIPGLPKLLSIISGQASQGKITASLAERVSKELNEIGRGNHVSC